MKRSTRRLIKKLHKMGVTDITSEVVLTKFNEKRQVTVNYTSHGESMTLSARHEDASYDTLIDITLKHVIGIEQATIKGE